MAPEVQDALTHRGCASRAVPQFVLGRPSADIVTSLQMLSARLQRGPASRVTDRLVHLRFGSLFLTATPGR